MTVSVSHAPPSGIRSAHLSRVTRCVRVTVPAPDSGAKRAQEVRPSRETAPVEGRLIAAHLIHPLREDGFWKSRRRTSWPPTSATSSTSTLSHRDEWRNTQWLACGQRSTLGRPHSLYLYLYLYPLKELGPVSATSIALTGPTWCPGLDSNQHGIAPTTPSRWRVYQFHHLGRKNAALIRAPLRGPGRGSAPVTPVGLEPTTHWLKASCSTD